MKIRHDDEQETAQINLTPMIDVVFLLIIFFMVTTTFIQIERELDIDLPEASPAEGVDDPARQIVVNLYPGGRIRVDGKDIDHDGLAYTLQRAAQKNPDQEVVIRGDRQAIVDDLVKVMDICQQARIVNLSVAAFEAQ